MAATTVVDLTPRPRGGTVYTKFHYTRWSIRPISRNRRRIFPIADVVLWETRRSQEYCRRDVAYCAGDFEIVDNAVGATRQNQQRFALEWTTKHWSVMLFIVTFSCSSCQHTVAVSSDFPVHGLCIIEDNLLSSASSSFHSLQRNSLTTAATQLKWKIRCCKLQCTALQYTFISVLSQFVHNFNHIYYVQSISVPLQDKRNERCYLLCVKKIINDKQA